MINIPLKPYLEISKAKKCLVLLSSGLDSTVNLYCAHKMSTVSLALTINYGQKASNNEIRYSKKLSEQLNIPHMVLEFPFFQNFTSSALINSKMEVPKGSEVDIHSQSQSEVTAKKVWVPNRNGVFINIAAAIAESQGIDQVIVGFNSEEAKTFPDNSEDFIESCNQSLSFSTKNNVKVNCFTSHLDKTEIVQLGKSLQVNFEDIWPCYESSLEKCGVCESCLRFKRAMEESLQ